MIFSQQKRCPRNTSNINLIVPNPASENRLIVQVKVKHGKGHIIADGDQLTVFTNEPRENGKANADVLRQLCAYLHVDQSRIKIIRGLRSTNKTVKILE